MGTVRLIWGYLEKFSLAMWGLNVMDILTIADIDFFKDIDEKLKTYFGIVGFAYLLIQLPFKVMELISKRKFNQLENEMKEEDLKRKKKHFEKLEDINNKLEAFDQVHKRRKNE